jgi:hypoxanthine phosphoribosyltransferase
MDKESNSMIYINKPSPNTQTNKSTNKDPIYPKLYHNHFSSLLIPHAHLQTRTAEIAKTISASYTLDEPLVLLCILKGSSPFFHLLTQELSLLGHPYMIDFYRAKSYDGTGSTGSVKFFQALPESIVGRNVIVVEDIVDTGTTLKALMPKILEKQPKSCKICSMTVKRLKGEGKGDGDNSDGEITKELELDYDLIGFSIPDEFVVGYGLDYNEMYRDLRDVWILGEVGIKGGGFGL